MIEERKAWDKQFQSSFGQKELLRFVGVIAGWEALGFVLSIVIHSVLLFFPFVLTALGFPFACRYWRPAYFALRWIMGNENLPAGPKPRNPFARLGKGRLWSGGFPRFRFRF